MKRKPRTQRPRLRYRPFVDHKEARRYLQMLQDRVADSHAGAEALATMLAEGFLRTPGPQGERMAAAVEYVLHAHIRESREMQHRSDYTPGLIFLEASPGQGDAA
jgi:hypothetical protein